MKDIYEDIYEKYSVDEPQKPGSIKTSMNKFDPAFNTGRIASLFVMLQHAANRSRKQDRKVDERPVINVLCSAPSVLISNVYRYAPIYTAKHAAGERAWQYRELQRLLAEIPTDLLTDTLEGSFSPEHQAIALLGYQKQMVANFYISKNRKKLLEEKKNKGAKVSEEEILAEETPNLNENELFESDDDTEKH